MIKKKKKTSKMVKKVSKKRTKPKVKAKARQKATKMTDAAVITMVVDESGSMMHLQDATIAGFNEYVSALQCDLKDMNTYFSATTFDTRGIRKLQVGVPINEAVKLSIANYVPNGGTPLLDAVGAAITATEEVVKQQNGTKIVVVIQTDGEENSSQKYNLATIKTMIEERQAKGWQFVFIGAGINAFADATKMGINAGSTMSYGANDANTRAVFAATANNTQAFARGMCANMTYSAGQSVRAGEDPTITLQKLGKVTRVNPDQKPIDDLDLTDRAGI